MHFVDFVTSIHCFSAAAQFKGSNDIVGVRRRELLRSYIEEGETFVESVDVEELRKVGIADKKLGNHSKRKCNKFLFILPSVYTIRNVYDSMYRRELTYVE